MSLLNCNDSPKLVPSLTTSEAAANVLQNTLTVQEKVTMHCRNKNRKSDIQLTSTERGKKSDKMKLSALSLHDDSIRKPLLHDD